MHISGHGKKARQAPSAFASWAWGGCLLLLVGILPGCESSQVPAPEVEGEWYTQQPPSSGGTGRIYMGREIAEVTDPATWEDLERPTREVLELPDRVVQALELRPANVVADIGAGTGYFTFRLSEAVPRGRVYAVDIQPEMLDILTARQQQLGVRNVETVLGDLKNPNLPAASIDLALIVFAYPQFSHPREMMTHVAEALKPGGRVVLVEYRAEDPTVPVSPLNRISEAQARREMEAVGLDWRETRAILPQQHLMVFEKPIGP